MGISKQEDKQTKPYFKVIFYLSGLTAVVLFVARFLGIFFEFPENNLILISAIILLVLLCIPSYFISKYRHERKLEEPLNPLEDDWEKPSESRKGAPKSEWGIARSPFRDQKSGLTWGGGNVKGANAKRGKRRGFLE